MSTPSRHGYRYGRRSRAVLDTCHPSIGVIFERAITDVDLSLRCGYRSQAEQAYDFRTGASEVEWPNGNHNLKRFPEEPRWSVVPAEERSRAIDWAPWVDGRVPWNDAELFTNIAFFLRGIAWGLGISVRLGADWDRDFLCRDNRFQDLGHLELHRVEELT